jgi:hypothetical protein
VRGGARQQQKLPIEKTARYGAYLKLCSWAADHGGNSPTERGLVSILGKSHSTVRWYVRDLISDGLLERIDGELVVVGATWKPPRRSKTLYSSTTHLSSV